MAIVTGILRRFVPELEVRAFGSRVSGKARKTSDLDLVLMTAKPLGMMRTADLRDALSDSDLSFKVDVVDWAATSDSFRRIIEKCFVVMQPKPGTT
ncbi:MAG: nucleotidyltransferase family protein [Stellaceae bacterium]